MSYEQGFGLVKHGNLLVASLKTVLFERKSKVPRSSIHLLMIYHRLAFEPAFSLSGIDYAEPLFVKNICYSQNMYKAWIFVLLVLLSEQYV